MKLESIVMEDIQLEVILLKILSCISISNIFSLSYPLTDKGMKMFSLNTIGFNG